MCFLEQLMAGASRRTKRVARNGVILEHAWTAERVKAWRAAQDLVAQAVPLYHPRPGCVVLMFPDASDFHWGSFFTQVPEEEFRSGVALENMFASSFVNVCIVWIRVLERSCLARMATRYMVCLLYTSDAADE